MGEEDTRQQVDPKIPLKYCVTISCCEALRELVGHVQQASEVGCWALSLCRVFRREPAEWRKSRVLHSPYPLLLQGSRALNGADEAGFRGRDMGSPKSYTKHSTELITITFLTAVRGFVALTAVKAGFIFKYKSTAKYIYIDVGFSVNQHSHAPCLSAVLTC